MKKRSHVFDSVAVKITTADYKILVKRSGRYGVLRICRDHAIVVVPLCLLTPLAELLCLVCIDNFLGANSSVLKNTQPVVISKSIKTDHVGGFHIAPPSLIRVCLFCFGQDIVQLIQADFLSIHVSNSDIFGNRLTKHICREVAETICRRK